MTPTVHGTKPGLSRSDATETSACPCLSHVPGLLVTLREPRIPCGPKSACSHVHVHAGTCTIPHVPPRTPSQLRTSRSPRLGPLRPARSWIRVVVSPCSPGSLSGAPARTRPLISTSFHPLRLHPSALCLLMSEHAVCDRPCSVPRWLDGSLSTRQHPAQYSCLPWGH